MKNSTCLQASWKRLNHEISKDNNWIKFSIILTHNARHNNHGRITEVTFNKPVQVLSITNSSKYSVQGQSIIVTQNNFSNGNGDTSGSFIIQVSPEDKSWVDTLTIKSICSSDEGFEI